MPKMIVDFHTHIFPPDVISDREVYVRRDATFAELYGDPRAKLASAEDLLASMDRAGIDVSVVLGFAWTDLDDCKRHNDYLLEAASSSNGRLVAFCTTQPRAGDTALLELKRCEVLGARGVGELRPADQGYGIVDTPEGDSLAATAGALELALLFHVSEPVGHAYPGKRGLELQEFARFLERHPDIAIIGAHWAGGLPFFASMPEIRAMSQLVWVDTAASSLLYGDSVYSQVADAIGAERILFGSDFPLLGQKRCIEGVRRSGLHEEDVAKVLGDNAARLLGLE